MKRPEDVCSGIFNSDPNREESGAHVPKYLVT